MPKIILLSNQRREIKTDAATREALRRDAENPEIALSDPRRLRSMPAAAPVLCANVDVM
jgi:hypothetical protein